MKLARQYFLELSPPEPKRTRFIARYQSYHGTTLGSLALGGHKGRRALFEPMLLENCSHVSPCYPYRNRKDGETDEEYVARLADELDAEFKRLGPETVCAFVAEPVVGAVSFNRCCSTTDHLGNRLRAICSGILRCHGARMPLTWSSNHF
jgi:adenosylmethionine-8-amino-7-oxononanoate aminotransferase